MQPLGYLAARAIFGVLQLLEKRNRAFALLVHCFRTDHHKLNPGCANGRSRPASRGAQDREHGRVFHEPLVDHGHVTGLHPGSASR